MTAIAKALDALRDLLRRQERDVLVTREAIRALEHVRATDSGGVEQEQPPAPRVGGGATKVVARPPAKAEGAAVAKPRKNGLPLEAVRSALAAHAEGVPFGALVAELASEKPSRIKKSLEVLADGGEARNEGRARSARWYPIHKEPGLAPGDVPGFRRVGNYQDRMNGALAAR